MKISGKMLLPGIALTAVACNEDSFCERPNILFCIADDATYAHFSAYGCDWVNTPGFDRVASEGVLFNNCYTPNAKSAPSRAVVLTGRYSWQLETGGNHITDFPSQYKGFVEALDESGYMVGYTGKGWAPGNPGVLEDGSPRLLTGKPYNNFKKDPPARFISDNDYTSNFIEFLEDSGEQPWFFWLGAHEPHRKYEYGAGVAKGGKSLDMIDRVPGFWPDNDVVRNDMLDYAFEIEHFDSHLVRILDELEKRGELDNTIVIVTADNGMPFPRTKANNYEMSHHQPLAVMWGAEIQKKGRKIDDYVNFVDIAPTLLEAAGVDETESGMMPIEGRSFINILKSRREGRVCSERDHLIFGRERDDYGRPDNQGYPIRGMVRDGMMLILNLKPHLYPACNPEVGYCEIDGSPTKSVILDLWRSGKNSHFYNLSMGMRPAVELYDINKDPDCLDNLAENHDYKDLVEKMRAELEDILTRQGDPRMGEDGDVFDRYPYYQSQDWNFYEKVISGEIDQPWKITDWITPTDYDEYVRRLAAGEIEPMQEVLKGLHW